MFSKLNGSLSLLIFDAYYHEHILNWLGQTVANISLSQEQAHRRLVW